MKNYLLKSSLLLLCFVLLSPWAMGQNTITEIQKVLASNGASNDLFGLSVSISGNKAIVGAPQNDGSGGAAYIYTQQPDGSWGQEVKLTSAAPFPRFGYSVAISENLAVVGAYLEASKGAVYVFELINSEWTLVDKLFASDGITGQRERFGTAVAISPSTSGYRIIVGADGKNNFAGKAYIYERSGMGEWIEVKGLTASDRAGFDQFGKAVSISGDRVIIGSRKGTGAAYIYQRDINGNWQEEKLTVTDGIGFVLFGESVAIKGDRALVGAPSDNDFAGSATVFEFENGAWQEKVKLALQDGVGRNFGKSVAISGDQLVVGAANASTSAYVYELEDNTWVPKVVLLASDNTFNTAFGNSVAIQGNQIIVGAPRDNSSRGSLYAFDVSGDFRAPVIADINDISVGTDAGVCTASVPFSTTVSDNVDTGITPVYTLQDGTVITSPHVFPSGATVVNVNATDAAGNQATEKSFTVTVTDDEAPVITVPADITVSNDPAHCGALVTFTAASATDNCSDVTLITNVANGKDIFINLPTGTAFFPLGTTTVTVDATDAAGNAAEQQSFTVTVTDNEAPIPPAAPADLNLQCASDVPLPVDLTAVDNCEGDITVSPTATITPGSSLKGLTLIRTWTFIDAAGNFASVSQTITVFDDQAPISPAAPADLNLQCASDVPLPVDLTAVDNCEGDITVSPTITITPGDNPNEFTEFRTWTFTDANGNTTGVSQKIVVSNSAPAFISIEGAEGPQLLGSEVALQISYTDAEDNLSSATIEWGDGSMSEADISAGAVSGSYVYSTVGVYEVKVTLEDACGLTAEQSYQYIVIYDPSAGFVTGGGWINSPEGAHPPDPGLTGKANFGFVSKYQKGARVPVGKTDFEFKAADLKFRSTSYEWLVVAGSKAKFKGEGTINGMGLYGFMLTATDSEDGDLFRIKIWDKASGALWYDNQMMAADDSYAGTRIGGGSIVVHDGKGKKNARTTDNGKTASSVEDLLGEEAGSFSFSYQAYPNPVLGELNLQISSAEEERVSFRVYDVVGRLVHESLQQLQEGENRVILNTGEWKEAKGKLIFQIQSPSQGVHWLPLLKK